MKIIGHSDYQTTANIYTHLYAEMMKKSGLDMEERFQRKKAAKVALAKSKIVKEQRSRRLSIDISLPWAEKF